MKKGIFIIVGIVLIVAIVGTVVVLMNQPKSTSTPPSTDTSENTTETQTSNETNEVSIKDMNFSPVRIKVKKGTTVTWTNEDSIGHNVIASDSSKTGGLPTNAPLLNQGETFSHTFDEVGTFSYNCAPHPFMRGAVEVTE
jgi:amicyanin